MGVEGIRGVSIVMMSTHYNVLNISFNVIFLFKYSNFYVSTWGNFREGFGGPGAFSPFLSTFAAGARYGLLLAKDYIIHKLASRFSGYWPFFVKKSWQP